MIKRLAACVREYKRTSILTPIFVSIEVVLECFIPFITARMINILQSESFTDMRQIAGYGILLVALAALSLTFGVLSGNACATASCGFAKNLRHDLYHKVQDFSFTNIDRFSTASLVTRLTTDVMNVQMAYMMLIRVAVRSPFMLVFALTMAFQLQPKIALVYLCIVPFLGTVLFLIIKFAMPLFNRVFKKYDKLNASIQENVKGMRVVKSFVREGYEQKKFSAASDDVCADFTQAEKIVVLNGPAMQLAIHTAMILVSFFGAKLIIGSNATEMAVGELSAILTYGMQMLMSLMMLSMIFVTLTLAQASANRIGEVLVEESTVQNPENPVLAVADGSVEFADVSFKYHKEAEKSALSHINLRIESGQTVGIIGATGSSKTSLVYLIPRLYDVTEGAVKVGGVDVREYDTAVLRDSVACVLQKNELFSGTIAENLRWGNPDASDEEVKHACELAQADEFVLSFPEGYETHIEQGGTNVSGGQKQRLCIARALLKKPKILILDDSTSAVDTRTDALIRKAFREELPNTTKIIIAQRISSVEEADKIIVMDDGKISAVGTHEELLKSSEIYSEVYYSQNKGGEVDGAQ